MDMKRKNSALVIFNIFLQALLRMAKFFALQITDQGTDILGSAFTDNTGPISDENFPFTGYGDA